MPEKKCPILSIGVALSFWKASGPDTHYVVCLETECALWNFNLGVCGLIAEGHLAGIKVAREEVGK